MQVAKHPAQRLAEQVLKAFPNTIQHLQKKHKRPKDLLSACLISSGEILNMAIGLDGLESKGHRYLSALPNIYSWRYSQDIYRFDPDLYREITETALDNAIRPEAFFTLPAWGIYIESPGFGSNANWRKIDGFFVCLSDDRSRPGYGIELRLTFVMDGGKDCLCMPVPLVGGTVEDCLSALKLSAEQNLENLATLDFASSISTLLGLKMIITEDMIADIASCLSLVLYLCSERPDTDAPRGRTSPQINRRGEVIAPPIRPKKWDVGLRFGAAFRKYKQRSSGDNAAASEHNSSGSKRPHVRRAHWHGYWYGSRADGAEREFRLRWLPPSVIGNFDDLTATVRSVKPE